MSILLALLVSITVVTALPASSDPGFKCLNEQNKIKVGDDPWPTDPPAKYVKPLADQWAYQQKTYADLMGFKNYGWDQLFAQNGSIHYCIRWDSKATVTTALRDKMHTAVQRSYQKWMDQMLEGGKGWDGWPYNKVPVKVVGWATRDRNLLQWNDTSVDIYVNDISENAPECAQACGRFFHTNNDYSKCTGGVAHHYDHSLWLTSNFSGGAGGDWGQRISSEYFTQLLDTDDIHILLHEMGHTYALDDFYTYDPLPSEGFIMKAGSATHITEFDKWMLRDFWRHLKSRYIH